MSSRNYPIDPGQLYLLQSTGVCLRVKSEAVWKDKWGITSPLLGTTQKLWCGLCLVFININLSSNWHHKASKVGDLSWGGPEGSLFNIYYAEVRCSGGRYSIPWIATLYPWSLQVINKAASSTIFESLVWLDLGLNPGLLDHWRTLYSLGQFAGYSILLPNFCYGAAFFATQLNLIHKIETKCKCEINDLKWWKFTHRSLGEYIYIYIYIYMCVCVCVCVCVWLYQFHTNRNRKYFFTRHWFIFVL